jgi:TRAP-type C4-dicarboxylate transport system permease small subunit
MTLLPFVRGTGSEKQKMSPLKSLESFFDRILGIFLVLACIILSFVMLSVCLEVFLRYFLNRPQVWVIELSEYALLYITFLGAAWVLRSDGHVTVDLFTALMSSKNRAICSLASFIVCFMVSIILAVYGIRVTWDHLSHGIYNPTILEMPKAAILLVIPLGGITLLIQSIRGAIKSLRSIMEAQ